ncbi:N-acetyltransferase 14, partial [Acipenser oxyrinchus oxyrinchus]
MPTLDLSTVLVREMREDEAEFVTELLKDCFRGSENRLVLYLLTRPCSLLLLAVGSSALRFVFNSFMAAGGAGVAGSLLSEAELPGVGAARRQLLQAGRSGSSDTRETRKDSDTSKASKVNEHSKTNTPVPPVTPARPSQGQRRGQHPGCSKPGSEDSDSEWSEGKGGVGRLGWGASFRVQLQLQPPPLAPALWVCESQGRCWAAWPGCGPLPGQALLCCLAVSSWHRRQGLGSAMVTRRAAGPAGRLQQRWGPRECREQGGGGLLPETGVRELRGWGEGLAGVQRDSGVQETAV